MSRNKDVVKKKNDLFMMDDKDKVYTWKDYVKSFGSYFLVLGFVGYQLVKRIVAVVTNISRFDFVSPSLIVGVVFWFLVFAFFFSLMFFRRRIEEEIRLFVSKLQ